MELSHIPAILFFISLCCVGFTTANPCHGAHTVSGGPTVSIAHSNRDTIDSALIQITVLKERIRQVEQLYRENGRFEEVTGLREWVDFQTSFSGSCSTAHVHLKRGANYWLLERDLAFIRATEEAEKILYPRVDNLQIKLSDIKTDLLGLMCNMHKITCRIQTYSSLASMVDDEIDVLNSRSQRNSRDHALFNHLKQVLECTKRLLDAIRNKVTPDNRCHGVVKECNLCEDLL